jgi:hypothetical protein
MPALPKMRRLRPPPRARIRTTKRRGIPGRYDPRSSVLLRAEVVAAKDYCRTHRNPGTLTTFWLDLTNIRVPITVVMSSNFLWETHKSIIIKRLSGI